MNRRKRCMKIKLINNIITEYRRRFLRVYHEWNTRVDLIQIGLIKNPRPTLTLLTGPVVLLVYIR
jgi:hypothetical protein